MNKINFILYLLVFVLSGANMNAQTVFFEDFGTATTRQTSPYMPSGSFSYGAPYNAASNTSYDVYMINDNHYAVIAPGYIKSQIRPNVSEYYFWTAAHNATGNDANGTTPQNTVVRDMSGTQNGAVMVVNAGSTLNSFYERNATVELGQTYKVSFNTYVVNSPIDISLVLKDVATGSILGTINSGYVNSANTGGNWGNAYELYFRMPAASSTCMGNQIQVSLRNNLSQNANNDFYLDNIRLEKVSNTPQNTIILSCPSSGTLDSDNDGIADICDLDDDNDGILDIFENACVLAGQTVRIGYIPNSRDLDTDKGYTFDGQYMSGSGALKLTNSANFGSSGTVKANIVLVPMTGTITKASIVNANLNAIFLGGIDNSVDSYLSAAELNAIKDWSDDALQNFVVVTQVQAKAWGATITQGNVNPDKPTSYGSASPIFNGPFGTITQFEQAGTYQAYFNSINSVCSPQPLAMDNSNRAVMYIDGLYNDLIIADVDILTNPGGNNVSNGGNITSNGDRLFANIWAFVVQQSFCGDLDSDNDGIPNRLDLNSDDDTCFDAIEGDENVIYSQIDSNGRLLGGVNANGVPLVVNAGGAADIGGDEGQGIGVSQNKLLDGCSCYKNSVITQPGLATNSGITSLQRAGANNGNWPMVRKGAWTALESKTKGFVPNRLTTQQIANIPPANLIEGMMVYNISLDCLQINTDGTASGWKCFKTQTCPDLL
ncbi:thrombospondin type 3 repeat-containing protein [Chryseobacterium sp. Leaf394]|uniref:thrombospondin type 3 repeat-containing protein n=1 Tax=Chryseobacterium sp. Leaf394 TaxID=1736361 RepID=UPI0012FE9D77|nr:thrombospondin type 3 repeat-containing protein [Chryseobacterium sp. Leaf394]